MRKRAHGQATRERLIEATIRLLKQKGLGAISTARVAREAGIVQSGFYAHFESLEACIAEAARRIGNRIRITLVHGLERIRHQGAGDYTLIKEQYQRLLAELQEQWIFVELFVRYFREPSPLGQALAQVHEKLRAELITHLQEVLKPLGLENRDQAQLGYLADLLISMCISSAESLRREPHLEKEFAAHLLTLSTMELGRRLIEKT
ncbi:TetR/AcrR family transcriptional regulator [Meiothermus sp. QL-1]|uniref:TetR/AcrR family transcriptional regulator n=1 Tax=Meiothermus sp. QL-1 TaxID=2058095 RepID=UPI000E0C97FC|nr:TetR/AcrR family transcriptional regulator [Meiothermus sp. QL-1]RDI94449.1 TetR/AcrR family transcriptional regulator [Meiothermus sp. QL-1]